ncbi:hypothetical protein HJC23_001724 [Cyclotella cryptica]|uniref:Uncharacterized protein n=1 Tax=Cyclotella cryptica TaxID=29204 RepID=A0ABD3QP60_9STRA
MFEEEFNRRSATPIMSGNSQRIGKTPHKQHPMQTNVIMTPSNAIKSQSDVITPQLVAASSVVNSGNGINGIDRSRQLYTPAHFTLSKNPHLHMDGNRPEVFSPNTIRMTDSLDKLLRDDDEDDTLQSGAVNVEETKCSSIIPGAGDPATILANERSLPYDAFPYNAGDASSAGGSGTFRRIQSSASSESLDDEEMVEFQNTEVQQDIGLGTSDVDVSEGRDGSPKPLNFDGRPGGAFEPPIHSSMKIIHGTGIDASATGGVAAVVGGGHQSSLYTPKPQRTVPRPAASQLHAQDYRPSLHFDARYAHQGNQSQQHLDPFFTPLVGADHQSMGYPSHHHPYAPSPPTYPPMHPAHHYPPALSPQMVPHGNNGYGHIPPTVVSPLTIPDYPGPHFPHPMHAASWSPIPPEFGVANSALGGRDQWQPPHALRNLWGSSEFHHPPNGTGFDRHHSHHHMINPHHHQHAHNQYGMGMPGHTSPEFRFHAMPGHVSPFMPHYTIPETTDYIHHQHHSLVAPHPHHLVPVPARQRSRSRDDDGRRYQQPYQKSSVPTSPTRKSLEGVRQDSGGGGYVSSPREGYGRPRKDSSASVNSGVSSSASIGGECPLSSSYYVQSTGKSLSPASPNAALREGPTGLRSTSSEEEAGQSWFIPHVGETLSKGVIGGSYTSQLQPMAPSFVRTSSQTSLKGRGKKQLPDSMMNQTQNIPYSYELPGDKKLGKKSNAKQPKDRRQLQQMQPKALQSKSTRSGASANQGVIPKNDDDTKRSEFTESPSERAAFKEFGRQFRQKENESLQAAREYALACISESNTDIYLPPSIHWRVFLELADVAKRCNETENARKYYRKACELQPLASQGWLEHSKLEEESGNLSKCASILEEGLRYCSTNENLYAQSFQRVSLLSRSLILTVILLLQRRLIRAVKFHERVGQLDQARQLLGRLKHLPIEKSWKTMLEGALLEARAGKYLTVAREILKYLTHHVPWYGPLYLAHTKLERDYGTAADAFAIVEKGLKELPRYGPLYFQAFCLLEKEDLMQNAYDLPRTMKMVSRADNISRELLWKVQLEAAQIQERAAAQLVQNNPELNLKKYLTATRRSYAKALMLCPPNLCWKIWLASGRTEVSCGNTDAARILFLRAYDSVSEKGRSAVLLECARLEEFCGDFDLARAILCKARAAFGKSDWKVWLATVNLESRCGFQERAINFAQKSLEIHSGTGRLWASLIQLRFDCGELQQVKILKRALQAVPKSGEVWCEGARIFMNPFSPTFDLQAAARHLSFAARFTPQYGDSFLEQLRLDMIDQWLVPIAEPFIEDMHTSFLSLDRMSMKDAYSFIAKQVKNASDVMKTQLNKSQIVQDVLDTSELELHCSSADPNYGHLWFQCRKSPIDTAREVINRAKTMLASDIVNYSHVYVAAMVRRAGILLLLNYHADMVSQHSDSGTIDPLPLNELPPSHSNEWDDAVNSLLRKAPSLDEMLWGMGQGDNAPKKLSGHMFVTGYVESNKSWDQLSSTEKQRMLFGSDSLLS